MMASGNYENHLLEELEKVADLGGKTIWDIGAHIGYHSLLFSTRVGKSGQVISFEPSPLNYLMLNDNVDLNNTASDQIMTKDIALSDNVGVMELQIETDKSKTSTSGSFLKNTKPPLEANTYKGFGTVKVKTDTIDHLIETGLQEPDILKIDVEGAEYSVLLGGQKLILRNAPVLIVEIHTVEMMFKCYRFLEKAGYTITIIDSDSPLVTRNILAVKKS
jgi:FkbM family methyltransferase